MWQWRIWLIREPVIVKTSTSAEKPSAVLMQRNARFLPCMAFWLGIQALADYGRAPWNEGLY
jgi:hypothetical protein